MNWWDNESVVTLDQARKLVPGNPSRDRIRVWCHRGARGVLLERLYVGGVTHTTREAIERFMSRINDPKKNVA